MRDLVVSKMPSHLRWLTQHFPKTWVQDTPSLFFFPVHVSPSRIRTIIIVITGK